MTKVFFKRGPESAYSSTEPNLEDSIIFKSDIYPFSGYSEVYLGSKLAGVGHEFYYGLKGLVPAPYESDKGKILTTDGWASPDIITGVSDVLQNPIGGSSTDRYPLILKGTADVYQETGDVNFSGMMKYGKPVLSATASGDLFAKSLAVTELVKSPGFLVSNPNGSPIYGLTSDTYIKADGSGYGGVFTGATSLLAGAAGLVPAPAAGDEGKYLKGDGTWGEIQGGTQSDWEEDDSTEPSYVQNRPAVRAGTGENGIVSGDLANNIASGQYSHAEGSETKALGDFSHSEGQRTIAFSLRSHAEGTGSNPSSYQDAPSGLTGAANATIYAVGSTTGFYKNMVLYYNGTFAQITSMRGQASLILSNTLDPSNALDNAVVKIVNGVAANLQSHIEGTSTTALGNSSHAEGNHTISRNSYEHSQGNYNQSNFENNNFGYPGNTIHSIGIGTSDSDRKNAVEVMQNGDVYITGVGDYVGDNYSTAKTLQECITDTQNAGQNMVSVTYLELSDLVTNSQLIPGQQYRITDYVCTTTQANTQSAGNQFDIIVVADSENTLNENARAIQHTTSNQDYFYNCDLGAWELKYCIYNDTDRFAWADDSMEMSLTITVIDINAPSTQVDTTASLVSKEDRWKWSVAYNNSYVYTVPNPTAQSQLYSSGTGTSTVAGTINSVYPANGKGVIYYMKDEWNNETPYDFKNIQFDRPLTNGVLDVDNGTTEHVYTFTAFDIQLGTITDASIMSKQFSYDAPHTCSGNIIREIIKHYNDTFGDYATNEGTVFLNNNVFLNRVDDTASQEVGYNCDSNIIGFVSYGNTFGNSCSGNSFMNNCINNSFGDNCYYNSFGNNCQDNTFGNYCWNNSFGNECWNNSFGNECYSNTFGYECFSNTFGNGCYGNSFGDNCSQNIFGNDGVSNSFGDNCYYNSFGNNCGNTFGDNCYYNTFGNNCYSNLFGNCCESCTLGDNCQCIRFSNSSGTARNYYQYIIVENGNQHINLDCTGTLSDSSIFRNVKIAQGVNNTTTYKTIQDSRTNQTFQTVYQPKDSEVISVA